MQVLVIGGAGYIGSHCCKALKEAGCIPVVFDNFSNGHREFVKYGPLIEGDLLNQEDLARAFHEYSIEAVMHFGGLIQVGESVKKPDIYYTNNISGTLNLLAAMARYQIKNLVFSSTCAVYGNPQWLPLTEDHPILPINPYGKSKAIVESILEDYDRAYQIKSICLRYFNASGADSDGQIGEDHSPETHLIPLILDVALGRKDSISIFGQDYPTPDGTCIRDYIHVADLAQAHLLGLKYVQTSAISERFNLGNNQGFSVMEVIRTVEKITGKHIPCQIHPRREGDAERLIGDYTKAKKILGWQPAFPDLETIITHAWQWHKSRFYRGS